MEDNNTDMFYKYKNKNLRIIAYLKYKKMLEKNNIIYKKNNFKK